MASASSQSSSSAILSNRSSTAAPAEGPRQVPQSMKKATAKFSDLYPLARDYGLGDEARRETLERGIELIRKVKPIIVKYAADEDGAFRKSWRDLSTERRAIMTRELTKVSPWVKYFEEGWAADWVLKKLINQRVNDRNRAKFKQKEDERAQRQLATIAHDALIISVKGNVSYYNSQGISNYCLLE